MFQSRSEALKLILVNSDTAYNDMQGRLMAECLVCMRATTLTPPTLIAGSAINYRQAPQYPFPCALQDALAACVCAHIHIVPPLIAQCRPLSYSTTCRRCPSPCKTQSHRGFGRFGRRRPFPCTPSSHSRHRSTHASWRCPHLSMV